jgi:hypothetical protein
MRPVLHVGAYAVLTRASTLESVAGDFHKAVLIDNGARTVALVVVAR